MSVCFVFSTVIPKPSCNIDEFKRLMSQLATDSLAEEHCLLYQVLQTTAEPGIYYVLSKFRDLEALESHEQSAFRLTSLHRIRESSKNHTTMKMANDASIQKDMSNESSFQRVGNVRLVVTVTVFDELQFISLAQRLTDATRKEPGNLSYTFAKITETVESSNEKGILAGPAETLEYLFIEMFRDEAALDTHSKSDHCVEIIPLLDACSKVNHVVKAIVS